MNDAFEQALQQIEDEKGISREEIISMIESSLVSIIFIMELVITSINLSILLKTIIPIKADSASIKQDVQTGIEERRS